MITIGESISRIKNNIKSVNQDAFVTDRYIYSLLLKYARVLVRRQDSENKMMLFKTPFQTLHMSLIEVNAVEAKCKVYDVNGCTFKRTEFKLPSIFDGYWGPLIRTVSSIDGSTEVHPTYRQTWEKMSSVKNFRFNKTFYYWYQDGYLYFPNLPWDDIMIEALFEEDITDFNCEGFECITKQSMLYTVPTGLHEEVERFVFQELGIKLQLPPDQQHDNKHIAK